ncbi:MAG TPA: hypothetical protein VLS90_02485, partial [Thermodesulfobacteriota bacterium]|nr:hypothetical protein [Thermodesulfobacteriota bacterium]
ITPGELSEVLGQNRLRIREIRGISPAANPVVLFFRLLRNRNFGAYRISSDTRISYIGYAVKATAP